MAWEIRISPEANHGLRRIERGMAGVVTDGIKKLEAMEDPSEGASPVEETDSDRHINPAYEIEIHAHFVTFSIEETDDRKVIRILEIE